MISDQARASVEVEVVVTFHMIILRLIIARRPSLLDKPRA